MRKALFIGRLAASLALFVALSSIGLTQADASPFGEGWTLDAESSRIEFQSIKKGSVVENSKFASFIGSIDSTGLATIRIQLDSVDTGVDLRNVRMRFLFFETFLHPEAIIEVKIDPAAIAALAERRRMKLPLDYVLDLHGVRQSMKTEAVVTLISDEQVSVASSTPISIPVARFGLEEGVKKLEEAASVTIVPSGSVTFDLVFNYGSATPVEAIAPVAPAASAVEAKGDFSVEECVGRFEILSRTGAVYFKTGSADLEIDSAPLLMTVVEIAQRCPQLKIVVEGHTDSSGDDASNQRLSEARAYAVAKYLMEHDVSALRIRAVGYGEARPVAPNDSERNKSRNRRIQFSADTQ